MKKIISINSSKHFNLVNQLDDNKKKNFKNRLVISIFVVLYYLLVLTVAILSDDIYLSDNLKSFDWIKGIENLKRYFALLLVVIIYIPLVFCILEACRLAFRKYEKIPILILIIGCSVAYLIPLCFFIATRFFLSNYSQSGNNNLYNAYYLKGSYTAILFGFASLLVVVVFVNVILSIYKRNNFKNVITLNTLLIIITLGFSGFVYMALFKGWISLMFLLLSVIITDVMCYLSGMLFGKHKMAKFISPNKTWEGAIIGSTISTGILLLFCFFLTLDKAQTVIDGKDVYRWEINFQNILSFKTKNASNTWLILFFVSVLLVIFSILGDLLFSYVKRKFDIKDFSNFLKSHGGFLDRVDSLLVTSLVFFIYTLIAIGIYSFVKLNDPNSSALF